MNEYVVNEHHGDGSSLLDLSAPSAIVPAGQINRPGELRRVFRGRYLWVALLAVIGAAGGAVLGYKSVTPVYRSVGLIEIKPYTPRIMFKTEQTQLMPMFGQFVSSQVELMQSPRVTNQAMQDDAWREFGWGMSPQARQKYHDSLEVRRRGRSHIIGVSFTDEDPKAANAAVKALIDAYMKIYGESDTRNKQERMKLLEVRQTALMDKFNAKTKQIWGLAGAYGSDSLEEMYRFELQELQRLKTALRTIELDVVSHGRMLNGDAENEDDSSQQRWREMSIDEIAENDDHMHALLDNKRKRGTEIEILKLRFADGHFKVQTLMKRREAAQKEIDLYAARFHRKGPAAQIENSLDAIALDRQRKQLGQLYGEAKQEARKLGQTHVTISGLKAEQVLIRERLQQTKERIEQLNLESLISGRISKISEGDVSPTPVNSGKRKQMAVAGFIGGAFVGVGLVMLVGLWDHRLRDSGDAELGIGKVRMLGLLPQLPENLGDSENATNACYAVHHIRTLLQLGANGDRRQVFAVTGPVPGTGKTSLTLALGLSFASSGCKTLLIDSDIGGGALTHRLKAIIRRRLGQILRRDELISDQQLQQALKLSRAESKPLGQTLVKMGALKENDLTEALNCQEMMPIGLLDALGGESLETCTTDTGIENLTILPVGGAEAGDIGRVSPQSFGNIIGEARKRFDAVLVDTGPIPAAVVSGIAASAADQTVVVISRGDQRASAERAITFLESIGASLAGVVFNRAADRDIARSRHCSTSAWSRRSIQIGADADDISGQGDGESKPARTDRFDPVTRAVAAAAQNTRNEAES